MNVAFAQTLRQLSWEALENAPTAHERRLECEEQIRQLEQECKHLKARRWRVLSIQARRIANKRLLVFTQRIETQRQQLQALILEEREAEARSRQEWDALNDAKRMVAEEHGRAMFRDLEPNIRERLCSQWRACEQVKRYEDETALTMAIGDVLMALGSTVPVATLAVLVVKIGVRKFCNCPV